ncbi:MAG TPA: YdeI/OmpD-associated family protein [Gemmatimonadales bacterium]|nr:YdeI/OmpD-associated family protein [Gemmatimonadales bacterium]
MGSRDPRIDAYIDRSAEFARPILTHIRSVVHAACPDVEETLKWGSPSFMYKGILCGMAAFKQHCAFGFWKGSLILGPDGRRADEAMGQFGRITKPSDLPSKRVLTGYVKQAMRLNEEGTTVKRPLKRPKPPLRVPIELKRALEKNRKARETFEGFTPSNKRDYAEWIAEAKGAETRQRRLAQAIEWMAQGKPRNWKYMR